MSNVVILCWSLIWMLLSSSSTSLEFLVAYVSMISGPSHHGVVGPHVVDGRSASDMECSCEYIE